MTREARLLIGLVAVSAVFLLLVTGLTLSLGWSLLGIVTLIFTLLYPVSYLCWKTWSFWRLPVMQLTTYAQILKEGEHNQRHKGGHPADLFSGLQKEIEALAATKNHENEQSLNIERLVSQMMDAWNVPICLFGHQQQLLYSNPVANELIQQPMLRGKSAGDLGFDMHQGRLSHGAFQSGWECTTIAYQQDKQSYWLFSAVDIADSLNRAEIASQKNLVRVLSHELRNSLTPMASMADTLLSSPQLPEQQVRLVLSRIQQRSDRLLNFIQQYAQLSQLPAVKSCWFEFKPLLDESSALLPTTTRVEYHGESQCYGDPGQLSQVLINLLKNAVEACPEGLAVIDVTLYCDKNQQYLSLRDNGQGFANLDNVLTPFYTTKAKGSGIGLALCAEIIRHHGGELIPSNGEEGGAVINIMLPLSGA